MDIQPGTDGVSLETPSAGGQKPLDVGSIVARMY